MPFANALEVLPARIGHIPDPQYTPAPARPIMPSNAPLIAEGLHNLANVIISNSPVEKAKEQLTMLQLSHALANMPLEEQVKKAQLGFQLKALQGASTGNSNYRIGPNGLPIYDPKYNQNLHNSQIIAKINQFKLEKNQAAATDLQKRQADYDARAKAAGVTAPTLTYSGGAIEPMDPDISAMENLQQDREDYSAPDLSNIPDPNAQ